MKNYNSTLTLFSQAFLAILLITTFTAGSYTVKTVPNVRLKQGDLYVSDPDNLLSAAAKEKINKQLFDLEERLTVEVAVVVLESIGQAEPRTFANELFKEWGIGKKEDDNGLLILLLTGDGERAVVFETGYGIEGVLPDILCFRIQQNEMLPYFKENDYNTGMIKGVEAVIYQLETGEYERTDIAGRTPATKKSFTIDEKMIELFLVIFFPFALIFLAVFVNKLERRKRHCPNCGKKTLTYVRKELIFDIYICSNCGYKESKRINTTSSQRGSSSSVISGGTSTGSSTSKGSSSGRSGGRSFGGGRSGGGGSISRF